MIAMLTAASLAGLAAHPAMGGQSPEEMATRAVSLALATAKRLEEIDEENERAETISLRVDDTISRAVDDLLERVGALETSLGVNDATPTHEGG